MSGQHKATREEDGDYLYRGRRIYQNQGATKGYWGRWKIARGFSFTTLREAKDHIDTQIDSKEQENL